MDVILYSKIAKVGADLDDFKDGYTEGYTIHKNLIDEEAELKSETKYWYVNSSGDLVLSSSNTATYTSYLVNVKENQKYTSSVLIRFMYVLDSDGAVIGSIITNKTSVDTTNYPGAKKLAISVNNQTYDMSEYAISEGDVASREVITQPAALPGWCEERIEEVEEEIGGYDIHPKKNKVFMLTDTSLDSEISFADFSSSVKSVRMSIAVNLSSFTSVTVGLKTSARSVFYVEVTASEINLYDYGMGGNTVYTKSYTHGLTIENNLSIDVVPNTNTSNYYIKIASNGQEYTTPSPFTVSHVGLTVPYASMVGSATYVQFSATSDIDRPIWVFGDSYLGTNNVKRWAYYLTTRNYADRAMLDGYAGENSASSLSSLQTLIQCGTPDYIVWCLGMNDGADTGTTPKAAWLDVINSVISICENNNIKLILATIPTVPSCNNEGKNAWVRASNYQYIDFAKAVGASDQGVWFTGMLDTDNVHPTQIGAISLFHAALAGCPQFNQK